MLIIILLLIVAIMLVGASAVLGGIGLIAGGLVLGVTLAGAAAFAEISGTYIFFGFLAFVALFNLMLKLDELFFEPRRVERHLRKESELQSLPEMSIYRNRKALSPESLKQARDGLIRQGLAKDSIHIKEIDKEISESIKEIEKLKT